MRRTATPLLLCLLATGARAERPEMPPLAPSPAPPAGAAPARPPESRPAAGAAGTLRVTFVPDHPSGVYYAKEEAKLDITAELPAAAEAAPLRGAILFGPAPGKDDVFKPSAITPLVDGTVKPGERVKLAVKVPLPAPGAYTVRLNAQDVPGAGGVDVRCVFAPRGADAKAPGPPDAPWVMPLPRPAVAVKGYLADFCRRTGVRRFVLDETWGPELTPLVRVLTAEERAALVANLAEARATLVLRLGLVPAAKADARPAAAFNQYVAAWAGQAKGVLAGVALDAPAPAEAVVEDFDRVRAYYLSAYDAVKRQNKSILMLGAGGAIGTDTYLVSAPRSESLRAYVDVIAAHETPFDVRRALAMQASPAWANAPVWVLPSGESRVPAAALKALGVAAIPVPAADRNVAPHLLGGAVVTERVRTDASPYIVVFQGDGYALAAVAGPGAGTPLDTVVVPRPKPDPARPTLGPAAVRDRDTNKLIPPHLEIADDSKAMRVVDARGNPVDCRLGDTLDVPVTDALFYVIAGGGAEDLADLLRTAKTLGVPAVVPVVTDFAAPAGDAEGKVVVALHNTGATETGGEVGLTSAAGQAIGEARAFVPISAGKSVEISLPVPVNTALDGATLDVLVGSTVQTYRIAMKK